MGWAAVLFVFFGCEPLPSFYLYFYPPFFHPAPSPQTADQSASGRPAVLICLHVATLKCRN